MFVQRHRAQLPFGEMPPPFRVFKQGKFERFERLRSERAILITGEGFEKFGIGHGAVSGEAMRCLRQSPSARWSRVRAW